MIDSKLNLSKVDRGGCGGCGGFIFHKYLLDIEHRNYTKLIRNHHNHHNHHGQPYFRLKMGVMVFRKTTTYLQKAAHWGQPHLLLLIKVNPLFKFLNFQLEGRKLIFFMFKISKTFNFKFRLKVKMKNVYYTTNILTTSYKHSIMDSLQDITYDALLSKLSSDAIEKFQEAIEKNLDAKKRRDICIVGNGLSDEEKKINVFYEFKNATKTELPFLMKEFPNYETFDTYSVSLFNLLILKHKNKLKGNKMFKDVLDFSKYRNDYAWYITCKIPPELITELYTNILGYKNLIEDINEVFDGYFTVCFKDEETWKFVDKLIFE